MSIHSLLYVHSLEVPTHERVRVIIAGRMLRVTNRLEIVVAEMLQRPSRWLPTGPDFCCLVCNSSSSRLSISVSDRKDYYRQL